MKTCNKCKIEKLEHEYHNYSFSPDRLQYACKDCQRKAALAYRRRHPERARLKDRRSHYKSKYGLTIPEYEGMFDSRSGLCDICHKAETKIHPNSKKLTPLVVDHNHDTGAIRGLLCNSCNRGLGYLRDSASILASA